MPEAPKSNGVPTIGSSPSFPYEAPDPFSLMRGKLNLALTALGELEIAINTAEAEARGMQELRALMRKML
jgi:hypothetical protein